MDRYSLLKLNQQKCEYRNYQTLTLQEAPGSVPAGRVPRYKEVELLGDLIDCARPGEEIDVIGIYTHTESKMRKDRSGFPVYGTHIKANCIQKKAASANVGLSEEDKRKTRTQWKIAKNRSRFKKIYKLKQYIKNNFWGKINLKGEKKIYLNKKLGFEFKILSF